MEETLPPEISGRRRRLPRSFAKPCPRVIRPPSAALGSPFFDGLRSGAGLSSAEQHISRLGRGVLAYFPSSSELRGLRRRTLITPRLLGRYLSVFCPGSLCKGVQMAGKCVAKTRTGTVTIVLL